MNGFRPVTDEDLHGFVDGDIEPRRRMAVQAFLATSPADEARVETWRRQNEMIRAAFARVETEPVPLSLTAVANQRADPATKLFCGRTQANPPAPPRQRGGPYIIAFISGVLAALCGVLLVGHASVNESPGITAASDFDFAGRALGALDLIAPSAANAPAAEARAPSVREAQALILPNLMAEGLTLAGVRILPGASDKMACLLYAKAPEAALGVAAVGAASLGAASLGAHVALCVEKAASSDDRNFRSAIMPSGNVVYWRQKQAKYALAGPLNMVELQPLAIRVRAEVEGFGAASPDQR
ncbi:MAG TPA: hypothetical protein VEQ35_09365 [Beijerinckia sp.]|nr:hypothetical protein [Beijerinckia sp.]